MVEYLFLLLVRVIVRIHTDIHPAEPVKPCEPNALLDLNRSNFDNFYVLHWRSLKAALPPRELGEGTELRSETPVLSVSNSVGHLFPSFPPVSLSVLQQTGLCVIWEGAMWVLSAASEGAAGGIRARSRAPGLHMSTLGPHGPTSQAFSLRACLSRSATSKLSGTKDLRASTALALLTVSSHKCLLPRPVSLTDPIFQSSPPGLTGSCRTRSGVSARAAVT